MTEKLNWEYDDKAGEQRAEYKGLRLRAVQDSDARNPFEDEDGHWPMLVKAGRNDNTEYGSASLANAINFFNDAQLVFSQHAIAVALGYPKGGEGIRLALTEYGISEDYSKMIRCGNGPLLRDVFEQALGNMDATHEELRALYEIAGIPALTKTVRGYSQGDWAELLIVACPDEQKKFGVTEVTERDLDAQADLYAAWAFGDVYGYIVERGDASACDPDDPDPEDIEWEELDSCWGYYGSDHGDSGLEEAAMSAADHHAKETVDV